MLKLIHNYQFEEHVVETPDGYFLTLWHLYNTNQDVKHENLTPLFLMHGILDEGTTWFV